MNNQRREKLRKAEQALNAASEYIEDVLDEEQDSLDNIPENLQGSNRYEQMEIAVDKLNEAIDQIESVKECLDEAVG